MGQLLPLPPPRNAAEREAQIRLLQSRIRTNCIMTAILLYSAVGGVVLMLILFLCRYFIN